MATERLAKQCNAGASYYKSISCESVSVPPRRDLVPLKAGRTEALSEVPSAKPQPAPLFAVLAAAAAELVSFDVIHPHV